MPRRNLFCALAAASMVLCLAVAGNAQESGDADASAAMPKWNASVGFGLHYFQLVEFNKDDDWWDVKPLLRIQVGRYLTPHLKAELFGLAPTTFESFEYETLPVAGLPDGGLAWTDRTVRRYALSPALTYQFFENTFAHPFVSLGANVSLLDIHRHRDEAINQFGRVAYVVPSIDTRTSSVMVRPFVAAGFKSYFNARTFVRSDISAAWRAGGMSQVGLRLDFGFDF